MNVNFTLGFMCYNTRDISLPAFTALQNEAIKLYPLVRQLNLVIIDNGDDGTGKEILRTMDKDRFDHITLFGDGTNHGQGHGRNRILLSYPSDFIAFIDGDIEVVPGSLYPMLLHIFHRPRLGCLSPHPGLQTMNPEKATPEFDGKISPVGHKIMSACTGYAIYRSEVFKKGIRFEESGPFYGPGWGLEDDDMYVQLTQAGWEVSYFGGMQYLQREPRSSWPALREQGVDIAKRFEERRQFFLRKWETKGIDDAIMKNVKSLSLGGLE